MEIELSIIFSVAALIISLTNIIYSWYINKVITQILEEQNNDIGNDC